MSTVPTVVYAPDGTLTVPNTFTVAPTQLLDLVMAQAAFNGASASGDFLPCFSIYAQSGQLLMRSAANTVTAGDSAEVSWFPFAEPQTTGGSTTTGLPWAIASKSSNISIASDGSAHGISLQPGSSGVTTDQSDNTIFDWAVGDAGVYGPKLLQNGLYYITAMISMNLASPATAGTVGIASFRGGWYGVSGSVYAPWLDDGHGSQHSWPTRGIFISLDSGGTPAPITTNVRVEQNSGSTVTSATCQLIAIQLNPTGSPNF